MSLRTKDTLFDKIESLAYAEPDQGENTCIDMQSLSLIFGCFRMYKHQECDFYKTMKWDVFFRYLENGGAMKTRYFIE